jgi:hypothetical protein
MATGAIGAVSSAVGAPGAWIDSSGGSASSNCGSSSATSGGGFGAGTRCAEAGAIAQAIPDPSSKALTAFPLRGAKHHPLGLPAESPMTRGFLHRKHPPARPVAIQPQMLRERRGFRRRGKEARTPIPLGSSSIERSRDAPVENLHTTPVFSTGSNSARHEQRWADQNASTGNAITAPRRSRSSAAAHPYPAAPARQRSAR